MFKYWRLNVLDYLLYITDFFFPECLNNSIDMKHSFHKSHLIRWHVEFIKPIFIGEIFL